MSQVSDMQAKGKIARAVECLRTRFKEGLPAGIDFRVRQLNCLKQMFLDNREELVNSLRKDYKKPIYEINLEIDAVLANIDYTIKNLHHWMAPANLPKDLINMLNTVQIRKEPLGVVLIITPWNYPIVLPMFALIGAISAGNCVVLKPSEISQNISLKLQELIKQYLSNGHYCVISGGVDVVTEILREKFDHIFYIGSGKVAPIVLEAAAKHITPVTLELGGKCPCYVDKHCDLELAAKKIAHVKSLNTGQICIAVDYVLCHQDVIDKLVELIMKNWIEFYGEDPSQSPDYGRIVNKNHFNRIMRLLKNSKGKVLVGGDNNENDCYIAPTLLTDVDQKDSLMSEEIFGPILPVIKVENCQEAIKFIEQIPKPLAVYAITSSCETVEELSAQTFSGSLIVNEIFLQFSIKNLPIGGVGASGMGRFCGKETFDTFSNSKSFYRKKYYLLKGENAILPPMTDRKYSLIKWFM